MISYYTWKFLSLDTILHFIQRWIYNIKSGMHLADWYYFMYNIYISFPYKIFEIICQTFTKLSLKMPLRKTWASVYIFSARDIFSRHKQDLYQSLVKCLKDPLLTFGYLFKDLRVNMSWRCLPYMQLDFKQPTIINLKNYQQQKFPMKK